MEVKYKEIGDNRMAIVDENVEAMLKKNDLLLNCKSDIPPFQMHENIYFVGTRKVSVHIIKTEAGLIMIDTGYPDMGDEIKDSMQRMGLNPRDIVAIFHSHGHFDHYGCTIEFKELSGAKTYISRIDNEIVNGNLKNLSAEREPLQNFDCDVLIEDGDVFSFGSTNIRCQLTPGHTPGVLTFFIETGAGDNRITAAMHGGVGMNSLKASWLQEHNLSFEWRNIFREGLHKLASEKVDLVLENHPGQNKTTVKLQKVLNGEPIIDRDEWQQFLKDTEQKLDRLIAEKQ